MRYAQEIRILNITGFRAIRGKQLMARHPQKLTSRPLFFKMAQNLDLRFVLVQAPWVLAKHVSNPE